MQTSDLSVTAPFSFVLFGASGHLATLKLYPSLYILALKKRLPEKFSIVGFARSAMDDASFRALVEKSIRASLSEVNDKKLQDFLSHVHYVQGQYDKKEDFARLAKALDSWEAGSKDVVRLAYLSIPPAVFTSVLKNLNDGGVHDKKHPFRCIVEKPVGNNLKSFEDVKSHLTSFFKEEEIFLLDHYLGKEAVRNIYYLRYANPILERFLKHTVIRHVEVAALEPAGIEGRAGYFEHTGTFRDMIQSHLLEMCALLTMRFIHEGESFRESRQRALEEFQLPLGALKDAVIQGQYDGYKKEDGIAKESRTNTFVALKLLSRSPRFEGIPFYLRSGKKLQKKETRISILFQESPHAVGPGSTPNRVDIILQGEAGMRLFLQTKVGGSEPKFRPLIMTDPLVCIGDCLPEHGLLLLEAIHGKQQWFLRFHEVQTAWKLLDPVQAYLDDKKTPLALYTPGSLGPKEATSWIEQDGTEWLD